MLSTPDSKDLNNVSVPILKSLNSSRIEILNNRRSRRKCITPKKSPIRNDPEFIGVSFKMKMFNDRANACLDFDTRYQLVYK